MTMLAEIKRAADNVYAHNAIEYLRLLLPIAEAAAELYLPTDDEGDCYYCYAAPAAPHSSDCEWTALAEALKALEKDNEE